MANGAQVMFVCQKSMLGDRFRVKVLLSAGGRLLYMTGERFTSDREAYEAAIAWCDTSGYNTLQAKRVLAISRANGRSI